MSTRIHLIVILLLLPMISGGGSAEDQGSARYPSLLEVVAGSAAIARVRIVEARILEFEVAQTTYTCGLALKGEVLESFVGPNDDFWFFVARTDEFDEGANEHLVVAEANGIEKAEARLKKIADYVSSYDIEYARCASSIPYSTALPVQALIPFEKDESISGGQAWLRPSRVSVASLSEAATREVEVDGARVILVSWADLRKAIQSARR